MQMQDNKRTNMYTLLPSNTQLQVSSLPVRVTGEFTKKERATCPNIHNHKASA